VPPTFEEFRVRVELSCFLHGMPLTMQEILTLAHLSLLHVIALSEIERLIEELDTALVGAVTC
jgi:hypothetical protein